MKDEIHTCYNKLSNLCVETVLTFAYKNQLDIKMKNYDCYAYKKIF